MIFSTSCWIFVLVNLLVQRSIGLLANDDASHLDSGVSAGGIIHVLHNLMSQSYVPQAMNRSPFPSMPPFVSQPQPPSSGGYMRSPPLPPPPPPQQLPPPPQHIFTHYSQMNGGMPSYNGPQQHSQMHPKQISNDMHMDSDVFGSSIFNSDNCGQVRPTVTKYVANGHPIDNHEQPWYVQIIIHSTEYGESETYCGGTLITPEWVLTAAHCYDDISPDRLARSTHVIFRGLQGIHRKFTAKADQVILNNQYVPAMLPWEAQAQGLKPGPFNDLALVRLRTQEIPSSIMRRLVPICMPATNVHLAEGTVCKIMGHGFTNADDEKKFRMPQQLQGASVRIANNRACQDDVESRLIKEKINDRTLCVRGPIQPCVGDSGGPLLCTGMSRRHIDGSDGDERNMKDENVLSDSFEPRRWYLVGVTSFAVSTDEHDHCGSFKSAVFGSVSKYLDWIRDTITKYSQPNRAIVNVNGVNG